VVMLQLFNFTIFQDVRARLAISPKRGSIKSRSKT
jgi:hypothetical protein